MESMAQAGKHLLRFLFTNNIRHFAVVLREVWGINSAIHRHSGMLRCGRMCAPERLLKVIPVDGSSFIRIKELVYLDDMPKLLPFLIEMPEFWHAGRFGSAVCFIAVCSIARRRRGSATGLHRISQGLRRRR
jgi:hypothetical protein